MIEVSKILLLVEGIDDAIFLRDVIQDWFGHKLGVYEHDSEKPIRDISVSAQIFALRGKDKIQKLASIFLQPIIDERSLTCVLVLFDADFPDNDTVKQHKNRGGVAARTAYIREQAKQKNIQLQDIFLFPRGNEDGDLENLLERIVTIPGITQEWDKYEQAITPMARTLEQNEVNVLSKKSKIFSYSEALTGFEKAGGRERNYRDTNHWNLDRTSQHLQPLHTFLKSYFDSTSNIPTP